MVPNWGLPVCVLLGVGLYLTAAFISRGKKEKEIVPANHDECQRNIEKEKACTKALTTEVAQLQTELSQFQVPRGKLKIKKGTYTIPGEVGLELRKSGSGLLGSPLPEILDRMVLDEKLVLGRAPYRTIFLPDLWLGLRKQLIIEFSHHLNDFSITVPEDTKITLPLPYSEIVY